MTVASILNDKGRDVFNERASAALGDICKKLGTHGVGAIVITSEKGVIEGIISERDIVKAIAREGVSVLDRPVSEFMTRAVVTCTEEEHVNEVMARMSSGRFRHVPVKKNGVLAGLISIGDVVKYRIAQIEREAEDMRSYIAMS